MHFARDLTHLSLRGLSLDDPEVYQRFLDTLHIARDLEVLVVKSQDNPHEIQTSLIGIAPVRLEHLRTLAIDMTTRKRVAKLLSHISLLSTTSVVIKWDDMDDHPDRFFPPVRSQLFNIRDPSELLLLWESGDYAFPLIKSGASVLPVFATTAVAIDDLPRYLRTLGYIFNLKELRRLSFYSRDYGDPRDYEPSVWRKILVSSEARVHPLIQLSPLHFVDCSVGL
ncbi:unnamed protein product [Somion occarium]|uniref:Uncharacterized protein n=1 Tax=Somion occarium TaxID=3059160 RepID=A0ABP1CU10_9APHY